MQKFEFSIEAESRLNRDAVFNLSAQVPDGWWEVNLSQPLRANDHLMLKAKGKPEPVHICRTYPS
jgi:type IV secretory pathway protease TraF